MLPMFVHSLQHPPRFVGVSQQAGTLVEPWRVFRKTTVGLLKTKRSIKSSRHYPRPLRESVGLGLDPSPCSSKDQRS